ncbi:MAG: phage scaffolding protein [Bacillota bacterium]|jgi:predicted RNase H-like nuclease (RuvC/YqgF family)
MKRDFLKQLGLSEEVTDKVIAEHGRTIERLKEESQALRRELEEFEGFDPRTLAKAQEDLAKSKYEHSLDLALLGAKAKNTKAVKALLELDNSVEEEELLARIAEVKAENPYLFEGGSAYTYVPHAGSDQAVDYASLSDEEFYRRRLETQDT